MYVLTDRFCSRWPAVGGVVSVHVVSLTIVRYFMYLAYFSLCTQQIRLNWTRVEACTDGHVQERSVRLNHHRRK